MIFRTYIDTSTPAPVLEIMMSNSFAGVYVLKVSDVDGPCRSRALLL